jgi:hypothetical protein
MRTLPTTEVDLFAQRIDNQGNLLWASPITITSAPGGQYYGDSTSDGRGGFLVAWEDVRDPGDYNIYAQRIAPDGSILWQHDGVVVCADSAQQRVGDIAPDGTGGAYVSWFDDRGDVLRADVYVQRVTLSGTLAWPVDVAAITSMVHLERPNDMVPDGTGGAIVIAQRNIEGNTMEADVLAQRVSQTGELLWGPEAVNVTPWQGQQGFAVALPDDSGGVYVAWLDNSTDQYSYDNWMQHVGANGNRLWPGHGVPILIMPGREDYPALISDGLGGIIVAWQDFRNDPEGPDLYAQRTSDDTVVSRYFVPFVLKNPRD